MDDYLSKPFSWSEFDALLARWLPQHAQSEAPAEALAESKPRAA
jgi:DNA-binding response OmpR family regulator